MAITYRATKGSPLTSAEIDANFQVIEGIEQTIIATTAGYVGQLAIADTPTVDGWYFASESGTYVNAGNLFVDTSAGLVQIFVSSTQTVFSKQVTPIEVDVTGVVESGNVDAVSGGTTNTALNERIETTNKIVNLFPNPNFVNDDYVIITGTSDYTVADNKVTINYGASPTNVFFSFNDGFRYNTLPNYNEKVNINFKVKSELAGSIRCYIRNNRSQLNNDADINLTFTAGETKVYSFFPTWSEASDSFYIQIRGSNSTALPNGSIEISEFLVSVDDANHDYTNVGNFKINTDIKSDIALKSSGYKSLKNIHQNSIISKNWRPENATVISYANDEMNVNFVKEYIRYQTAFKTSENNRVAIILDYNVVSESGASDINVYGNLEVTNAFSTDFLNYTLNTDTVEVFIADIGVGVGSDVFLDLYVACNTTTTPTIIIKNIMIVDLGVSGGVFYDLSADTLKEYYNEFGYFNDLVYSNISKLVENSLANSSVWKDKQLLTIGHSIVYQNTWQPYLAEYLGLNYDFADVYPSAYTIPLALGGAHIRPFYTDATPYDINVDGAAANDKKNASIHNFAKQVTNFEGVICLMSAQNDSFSTSTLGTRDDASYIGSEVLATDSSDPTIPSLWSSIKGLLEIITTNNPKAKVVYMSIMPLWFYDPQDDLNRSYGDGSNRYNQYLVERDACEMYSVQFIDLWKDNSINSFNAGEYYKADSDDQDWIDNHKARVHPNDVGGERIAKTITGKLN